MDSSFYTNVVIAPLLQRARIRTYGKGQIVLYPGDSTPYLFLIKKGAVTMHDVDDQDNQKILHIFGPPALFPMVSFSADMASAAWFYSTLVKTEVYLLPYAELKKQLEQAEGVVAYNLLLKQLLGEVHELIVRINSMTKTNSLGRLVAALKFLATYHSRSGTGGWRRITFPVSHKLLADMTGLARETVSLTMKQLQQYKSVRNTSATKLEVHVERLGKIAPR